MARSRRRHLKFSSLVAHTHIQGRIWVFYYSLPEYYERLPVRCTQTGKLIDEGQARSEAEAITYAKHISPCSLAPYETYVSYGAHSLVGINPKMLRGFL